MKNRYDGAPGKEAAVANNRQARLSAEHNANDAFVKRSQAAQAKFSGKAPKLEEKSMHFDAYMCNNGEHAQSLARKLTKGMDKAAFPLK